MTRPAFYDYLDRKGKPWKYEPLVEEMMKIHDEDKCNDTYGRERMYLALMLKKEAGEIARAVLPEICSRKMCQVLLTKSERSRMKPLRCV